MTLGRHRFVFNRHLTWLVPPIDPQRRWIPGPPIDPESCILEGVDGDRWDAVVRAVLTAIYHSEVGRAVISCVRRRTSLYHVAGSAQAFPDSYEAADGEVLWAANEAQTLRAAHEPVPAVITVDLLQWPPPVGTTPQTREGRLLHELVHAVNITWGAYAGRPVWDATMQRNYGADGDDEVIAWMIENMWRGERGLPYRSSYLDSRPLDRPPTDGETGHPVTTLERAVVDRLRHRVPALAWRLWQLPARATPYNPFRDR